jgi:hypothetical protein
MQNAAKRMGFEELSPERIANELFAHLTPGDKVAITSRHIEGRDSTLHEVQRLLKKRGLIVRVMENKDPMHDFCFLKHAQKELVGTTRSTFVMWAAYLGNANITRLYTLDQKGLVGKDRGRDEKSYIERQNKTWTNPNLKARIHYELYQTEEMEALTASEQA